MKDIEQSLPATIKCPFERETPLKLDLPEGRLAAVCQEVPPSFFRISVDAYVPKEIPPDPPVTM